MLWIYSAGGDRRSFVCALTILSKGQTIPEQLISQNGNDTVTVPVVNTAVLLVFALFNAEAWQRCERQAQIDAKTTALPAGGDFWRQPRIYGKRGCPRYGIGTGIHSGRHQCTQRRCGSDRFLHTGHIGAAKRLYGIGTALRYNRKNLLRNIGRIKSVHQHLTPPKETFPVQKAN